MLRARDYIGSFQMDGIESTLRWRNPMPSTVTCNFPSLQMRIPAADCRAPDLSGESTERRRQPSGRRDLGWKQPSEFTERLLHLSPAEGAENSHVHPRSSTATTVLPGTGREQERDGQYTRSRRPTVPTGSAAGNYELTVVVEDARATIPARGQRTRSSIRPAAEHTRRSDLTSAG